MDWFHEDPEYTLNLQVTQSDENSIYDIYDLSPSNCHIIENKYKIHTIGQLVYHIIHNGFPEDVVFNERTKLVLSVRVANKFIVKQ